MYLAKLSDKISCTLELCTPCSAVLVVVEGPLDVAVVVGLDVADGLLLVQANYSPLTLVISDTGTGLQTFVVNL